jgi:hypothetical protein
VVRYTSDGEVVDSFLVAAPTRPVTRGDVDTYRKSILQGNGFGKDLAVERLEEAWEQERLPKLHPTFVSVATSPEGLLWVQLVGTQTVFRATALGPRYSDLVGDESKIVVIDPSARSVVGSFIVPRGGTLAAVGSEFAAFVEQDDLGVQKVAVYKHRGGMAR